MTDHEFLKKLYHGMGIYNTSEPMIRQKIGWQLNDEKPNFIQVKKPR